MPHGPFPTRISIDPWHVALALCDWIGHRSNTLEAPEVLHAESHDNRDNEFLANDFRNRQRLRRSSLHGVGLAVLVAAFMGGCSQLELPLYPVSGHVAFEGEWPRGAQVVLHPLSDELTVRPRGEVDFLGNFRVGTYGSDDGAPAGEYIASLTWHPYVIDGEDYKPGRNVLPETYATAAMSPLLVEVKERENKLPPWLLSRCDETPGANASGSPEL